MRLMSKCDAGKVQLIDVIDEKTLLGKILMAVKSMPNPTELQKTKRLFVSFCEH